VDATEQPKKMLCGLTAARIRPDSKRKFCCAGWHSCADATGQPKNCAPWHCCSAVTGQPIKNLRALTLQRGCDRTAQKKGYAWPDAAARLKKILRDWKKLQRTDLRGQACADRPALTGQSPVQPVFNTGSTGFGQDGPDKIWLKTAELKFSSEVQLASSS
jgi:hypothetical protein